MSWAPERLLDDVEAKPDMLRSLAGGLRRRSAWSELVTDLDSASVLLVGIGSSRYAAEVAARRLRVRGISAIAESSSAVTLTPSALNVVISAGGTSAETLAAAVSLRAAGSVVAVTNDPFSTLAEVAHHVVTMDAGVEVSGVASRSFAATLVRLLELEVVLTGDAPLTSVASLVDRAADAVDDLLARRVDWLDDAVAELAGPDGTWLLSPLERWSSAMQGALMLREVPRRPAVGCETGEWSHVDVYLTKSLDYRAIMFTGSPWDAQAVDWMTQRGSAFWSVGGELSGAVRVVRYAGDDDPDVALLAEVTVAELLASALWAAG
jgi:glucosamine 6-phosphate synthetase-like amidotransferase/phosphosugar isomerase protein